MSKIYKSQIKALTPVARSFKLQWVKATSRWLMVLVYKHVVDQFVARIWVLWVLPWGESRFSSFCPRCSQILSRCSWWSGGSSVSLLKITLIRLRYCYDVLDQDADWGSYYPTYGWEVHWRTVQLSINFPWRNWQMSRSNSFFYFTEDRRFMVKTCTVRLDSLCSQLCRSLITWQSQTMWQTMPCIWRSTPTRIWHEFLDAINSNWLHGWRSQSISLSSWTSCGHQPTISLRCFVTLIWKAHTAIDKSKPCELTSHLRRLRDPITIERLKQPNSEGYLSSSQTSVLQAPKAAERHRPWEYWATT